MQFSFIRSTLLVSSIAVGAGAPGEGIAQVIDDFSTPQAAVVIASNPGPHNPSIADESRQSGDGIAGMERDIHVSMSNGGPSSGDAVLVEVTAGQFILDVSSGTQAVVSLSWDGTDNSASPIPGGGLNTTGLGGIDITSGGTIDAIALSVLNADSFNLTIVIHDTAGGVSTFDTTHPGVASTTIETIPFSSFTGDANFTMIGAMLMQANVLSADFTFAPRVAASVDTTLTDISCSDTSGDGTACGPGDTITYTVRVANNDDPLDQPTDMLTFDFRPENSTLVPGSVVASDGGTVVPDDTVVTVTIDPIPDGGFVEVTFDAIVDENLPPGIPEIVAQGKVTDASGFLTGTGLLTDDVETPGDPAERPLDPTITPLVYCGNGAIDTDPEQCDDGNANDRDDCPTTCVTASCGDGFVHDEGSGTEECDDGNDDESDDCTSECSLTDRGRGLTLAGGGCSAGELGGGGVAFALLGFALVLAVRRRRLPGARA